jgi:hypothetical protein
MLDARSAGGSRFPTVDDDTDLWIKSVRKIFNAEGGPAIGFYLPGPGALFAGDIASFGHGEPVTQDAAVQLRAVARQLKLHDS